jgi:hypothetical protein
VRRWLGLHVAVAGILAVAAVLGRLHALAGGAVEVAVRPAIVRALFDDHQFLGRQLAARLGGVQLRPAVRQLVTSVLDGVQLAVRVERLAARVAQAGDMALRGREALAGLVRVVLPQSGTCLELTAGVAPRRGGLASPRLAGVALRTGVHEQVAVLVDDEGMHEVVPGHREAGNDLFGLALRHGVAFREGEPEDRVVLLGIQRAVVQRDTRAAGGLLRHAIAEALDDLGLAVSVLVLQRDQEAALGRLVVAVVEAAPGVHVDDALGGDRQVPGVAEVVREDGRAEAGGQGQAAVARGAAGRGRRGGGGRRRSLGSTGRQERRQ